MRFCFATALWFPFHSRSLKYSQHTRPCSEKYSTFRPRRSFVAVAELAVETVAADIAAVAQNAHNFVGETAAADMNCGIAAPSSADCNCTAFDIESFVATTTAVAVGNYKFLPTESSTKQLNAEITDYRHN